MSAELKFLLCEDVRTESNGKLTLVGVYPGEIIVLNKLPPDAHVPARFISVLPRLAIVLFLHDGAGSANGMAATVKSPSGELVVRANVDQFEVEKEKVGTLIVQTGPIGVSELGSYLLELSFGGRTRSFTFEVRAAADFVFPKKPRESAEVRTRGQKKLKEGRKKRVSKFA